ncbi:NRAMP family divalent metal transporter [Burkholderia plantarii]|uniref:NRAMP family divalent metal transporter n=1 Tax=Burkholderia plantarii TaxID=41899 RepID=UPI0006D890A0|nr:NRAMP family divalent metal transporter [Burkholderia plantarii]ALK35004.1 natural resistance-associated macrophage protein [Burkholderia plantarii]WLE61276.1 divalent metal cation transporter [Burkholderia plantarii]GLZ19086.1 natural resistance-associated macrophage protein [Burkholderia plantarii]
MSTSTQLPPSSSGPAVLDDAHIGDIRGALGTIDVHDTAPRKTWAARLRTLLAILGPGLIVMVGDNDAGAFGTYTQAGQNYGTTLLWTLLLLIPVLYVNQEMVARLGAVTGVGHARLIFARFGRFWGAFSAIDLFVLNALTIVTEFIGVTFALHYFGLPKVPGVIGAAVITIAAVCTGSFRRFERFALVLVAGSLLLIPVLHAVHPPASQLLHDFLVPGWPRHAKLADVMLLVIGIVGTTVAPWQLFFQQSYVVDKRITPAFSRYEKLDLWLGIGLVMIGAVAMIGFSAAMYAGKPEFGNFTDAGAVLAALDRYVGSYPATVFAIALLDACVIGAAAVSLATAYAVGDVLGVRHSLHRPVAQAKWFYLAYAGLIALAAAVTLVSSDAFLGFLTNAVQALAGVLLPSATVFLLLLCNDRAVLGPWCNGRVLNLCTGAIVWVLVMLSIVLTAATVFPDIEGTTIVAILVGGSGLGVIGFAALRLFGRRRVPLPFADADRWSDAERRQWRMPPLHRLPAPSLSAQSRLWMGVLRGYLVIAVAMIGYEIVRSALA